VRDVEQPWVEGLSNSIIAQVASNWQVTGFHWPGANGSGELGKETSLAYLLRNAERIGRSVGNQLVTQNWNHVHFIAHSGGSALIQAASEQIKLLSPATEVHTTFLDPYVGFFYSGANKYGRGADWADNYYASGNLNVPQDWPRTGGRLDYAYNVDVTALDSNREYAGIYFSGSSFVTCYQSVSSHGWPIDFYRSTIPPNNLPGAESFGFPLSKAGGGWQQALAQFGILRGNSPRILGEQMCIPVLPYPRINGPVISLARAVKSSSGTVQMATTGFTATSGSPVWVAVLVPVADKTDFVTFEAAFVSSPGAAGLLTVFWDNSLIGMLDERVDSPGLRYYSLPVPETSNPGEHLLGFQLDPDTSVASRVVITNVTIGFSGIAEPFSLSIEGAATTGPQEMTLKGPASYKYLIQGSTNLIDWSPVAMLVNTNGTVDFTDSAATNLSHRFYRAAIP